MLIFVCQNDAEVCHDKRTLWSRLLSSSICQVNGKAAHAYKSTVQFSITKTPNRILPSNIISNIEKTFNFTKFPFEPTEIYKSI